MSHKVKIRHLDGLVTFYVKSPLGAPKGTRDINEASVFPDPPDENFRGYLKLCYPGAEVTFISEKEEENA